MNCPVRLQREAKQGLNNDARELKGRSSGRKPKHKRHQGRLNKVTARFSFSLGSKALTGVIMNDDKLASSEATGIGGVARLAQERKA
jgi:hypothetical protein